MELHKVRFSCSHEQIESLWHFHCTAPKGLFQTWSILLTTFYWSWSSELDLSAPFLH